MVHNVETEAAASATVQASDATAADKRIDVGFQKKD
jgi:hypothetical protein